MDNATLEILLNKVESDTLDFKAQQYRFYGANDDDKSELLKDILAFANGWKETDAYIIIGINEKDGRAAAVTGISVHLADNDVQQFINSKTNKAVTLAVETVPHSGVELDVIRIAQAQTRPIYCRRGFGKLREGTVYVRRGSSTAIADPDEVSAMGRTDAVAQLTTIPTLAIEFGNRDERVRFGTDHLMTSVSLLDPPPEPIHVHPRQPAYLMHSSWNLSMSAYCLRRRLGRLALYMLDLRRPYNAHVPYRFLPAIFQIQLRRN